MAKVIGADKLAAEIENILKEYGDDINDNIGLATAEVTKAAVKALKQEARNKFKRKTGDYAKGWTSKVEKERLKTTGIIYNSKVPGLPHLLEHGHAVRVGGRNYGYADGKEHIALVEDKAVKDFENKVVRNI